MPDTPPDAPPSRRTFMTAAGGALAGTVLAASGAGAQTSGPDIPKAAIGRPMPRLEGEMPEPPGRRVGWAVVGLGQFALNQILPAFAQATSSKLVALVSGSRDKAAQVGERYGVPAKNLYDYAEFDRIRDNPEIDVVYVILPNGLHAEYTIRAFRAGKHVMCEKPMANTVAECEAMIAAGRAADRKLMIAYRAHFEPHNVRAMGLARAADLGAIRLVTSDHHRPLDPSVPADQWRMNRELAGGGSLVDIGIYSLQAARYMTGEEPIAVAATISSAPDDPRFREVEDLVTFQLRFPSGAIAHLSSSYSGSNLKRIQAIGAKAIAILDPATEYQGNRLMLRTAREQRDIKAEAPSAAQFSGEIDHLSACVTSGKTPKTPGEEGLRDVRLMKAIYAAAALGRWLPLNPDGSHGP